MSHSVFLALRIAHEHATEQVLCHDQGVIELTVTFQFLDDLTVQRLSIFQLIIRSVEQAEKSDKSFVVWVALHIFHA